MNPFDILGIPRSSSTETARAAYRKLAMRYHPDRVSVNEGKAAEAKFKEIKAAWELIESGWTEPTPATNPMWRARPQPRPQARGWMKPEAAWAGYAEQEAYKRNPFPYGQPSQAYQKAKPKINPYYTNKIVEAYQAPASASAPARHVLGDFIARVSMAEAYHGFICEVTIKDVKHQVHIPKGIPHGLRFTIPVQGNDDVIVTTIFNQSVYKFVGVDTAVLESVFVNSAPAQVYRTKDLTITHEMSAEAVYNGATIKLQDFLGEEFSVKVPSGHNCWTPIKVEGRGYVDWYTTHSQAGDKRGDVYITIKPTEIVDATMMH